LVVKQVKKAEELLQVEEPATVGAFQAKTELSRLLREARAGKRFIITQRGKPVAELRPIESRQKPGKWGDMEGKIWVADDFCEEIEDMKEYME
jgi:prevent-host-death family protein